MFPKASATMFIVKLASAAFLVLPVLTGTFSIPWFPFLFLSISFITSGTSGFSVTMFVALGLNVVTVSVMTIFGWTSAGA